jgi:hypothetical protein
MRIFPSNDERITLVPLSARSRVLIAVFLLSCAALIFQVAQTRLFSATFGYHLTFVAVSIALLGVGAGATAATLLAGPRRAPSDTRLAAYASATFVLALAVTSGIDAATTDTSIAVVLLYAVSSVPYVLVSWFFVRVLSSDSSRAGRTYAADLAGAAAGGVVAFVAISVLGAQAEYGLAAALAALAALIVAPAVERRRVAILALAPTVALTVALALAGDSIAPLRPAAFKAVLEDERRGGVREAARWDPQGRVDVIRTGERGTPGAYEFVVASTFHGERPPALVMRIDFDAGTEIVENGTRANGAFLDATVLGAPYVLLDRPDVLVIGPGGGIDVLLALHRDATAVTGVDVNRAVIALMRDRYRDYGGALYEDPRVTIVADEARSFVRRSNERFDVIVMTVVDSWAALQSGSYALSESYLYTEEAFVDYLRHLTPHGVLAVGRWYRDPPVEMLRLVEIAGAGLRRSGIPQPERNIVVVRHEDFGLLLVRGEPFADTDLARIRTFAADRGFEIAYEAGRGPLADELASAGRHNPATDDRPFFFDTVPLAEVLAGRAALPQGYATLVGALFSAALLSLAVVVLPLWRALRDTDGALTRWVTANAVLFGTGFIVVELVMLQRLTLYLGQPALALAVSVAALLLGAAIGSASVPRLRGGLRGAVLASALVLAVVLAFVPAVADATLSAPLSLRIVVAAAVALALGFPLGTAFPRVLATAGEQDASLLAWAWGINGVASVIGSIVAAGLALEIGFGGLGVIAVACYLLATLLADAPRGGLRRRT